MSKPLFEIVDRPRYEDLLTQKRTEIAESKRQVKSQKRKDYYARPTKYHKTAQVPLTQEALNRLMEQATAKGMRLGAFLREYAINRLLADEEPRVVQTKELEAV